MFATKRIQILSNHLLTSQPQTDLHADNVSLLGRPKLIWIPKLDVLETDKEFIIQIELPGLKKEQIYINEHNSVLEISGERESKNGKEKDKYVRRERSYGKFKRSFALPKNIDPNSIKASFLDGILEVKLSKKEAEPAKEINIQ
eukprot:TRINITY_DN1446_c0_g1_i1.p1 TRINITY_DN1446_c0_g1~~TRINITY_DN1446_c0_g1_i1.p1  ORF type:complete len:144 (-),score=35.66 TRINITY_DN1446_c0_g1_i1:282-713(-)